MRRFSGMFSHQGERKREEGKEAGINTAPEKTEHLRRRQRDTENSCARNKTPDFDLSFSGTSERGCTLMHACVRVGVGGRGIYLFVHVVCVCVYAYACVCLVSVCRASLCGCVSVHMCGLCLCVSVYIVYLCIDAYLFICVVYVSVYVHMSVCMCVCVSCACVCSISLPGCVSLHV